MTLPVTLLAYTPELETFDRALAAPNGKGIRVEFPEYSSAKAYVARLHQARVLDRRRSMEINKPGDPMYGCSPYDEVRCSVKGDTDGKWWVYLEIWKEIPGFVEELIE